MPSPDITLYFLNSSRAIRIAWLLEELNLPYNLVRSDRAPNGLGPPEFKSQIPSPLQKSPTIKDGDIVVTESGAIVEYLCERYDTASRLFTSDPATRAKVREWLHAAEGTLAVHAMPILYSRWDMPEEGTAVLPALEQKMSGRLGLDMDWLEGDLRRQREKGRDFVVGESLSAADIQLQMIVDFLLERKLGNKGHGEGRWPEIEAWLERTKAVPSYQRAVEKTGYTLSGNFKK